MQGSWWRQLCHAHMNKYFLNQYQNLHFLQVCVYTGKNLCPRACQWSVVSCIACGVTGKMVEGRSQPTAWLGLPGEGHPKCSFRLQATCQSLPEKLQVTRVGGGNKLWKSRALLFPFCFQKPSTWSSCSSCSALHSSLLLHILSAVSMQLPWGCSGFSRTVLVQFLLGLNLGYKLYRTKAKAESAILSTPMCVL